LGDTALLKFGKAKTSKIRCDLGHILTLTTNISGTHGAVDKRLTALLSKRCPYGIKQKKNWELLSTNKEVIGAYFV